MYFAFSTDDVWLNLHHYLYVLGRSRSGTPDATQQAVWASPPTSAKDERY